MLLLNPQDVRRRRIDGRICDHNGSEQFPICSNGEHSYQRIRVKEVNETTSLRTTSVLIRFVTSTGRILKKGVLFSANTIECFMAKVIFASLSLLVLSTHASLQPPDSDTDDERGAPPSYFPKSFTSDELLQPIITVNAVAKLFSANTIECFMAKVIFASLSLLVLSTHASLQPPDSDTDDERAKASQADYLTFLVAAGAPKCLFPCVKDLVGAGVNAFDARNIITKTEIVCKCVFVEYQKATACVKESGCKNTEVYDIATKGVHSTCVEKLPLMPMVAPCLKKHAEKALLACVLYREYQKATACVKESGCKNTEVYDIATKGVHSTCVEKLPLMPMVAPCLKKHAEKALLGCDKSCGLTDDIDNLTTKEEVRELADKGGDIYALMEYAGPVCNSITCFLSCAHKRLERKCPSTGTAFVDSAVRPFEAVARYLQTAPKSTVDAVNKHLPAECKSLIDIHYLGRLKFFGALPDRKGVCLPSERLSSRHNISA
uniref:CPG4 domain-containing protein n=1 Tax=Ascaris lumbricoides TaxID=6252 RepID=A0A0M3HS81_ASCLU